LFFKIQAISPSPKNPGFGFLGEGREGGGGHNSPLNALSKIDGINADNSFPVSACAVRPDQERQDRQRGHLRLQPIRVRHQPPLHVIASRLLLAAKQSPFKRLTLIERHYPFKRGLLRSLKCARSQ
jgi:hypothetical protein